MKKLLLNFLASFDDFRNRFTTEIPSFVITDGQRVHRFILLIKLNQLINLNMLISKTILPFDDFILFFFILIFDCLFLFRNSL